MSYDSRIPHAPQEHSEREVIEKLAVFIVKNGHVFEERTRHEQANNPRFAFLFGGPFSDYYQYCLFNERYNVAHGLPSGSRDPGALDAGLPMPPPLGMPPPRGQAGSDGGMPPPHPGGPGGGGQPVGYPPPPQAQHQQPHAFAGMQQPQHMQQQQPGFDFAAAQARIEQLHKEITDSERNLQGHLENITPQKETLFQNAIADAEAAKISAYLEKVKLDVTALDVLLNQLIGKCSKDVVSSMKKWIFENCTTDQLREVILTYLLHRVRNPSGTEQFRLHVLYLINDWAHYCQRKKLDGVRQMLSRYVPQLYAFAADATQDAATMEKLEKLVGVWEGHKYFDDNCFKQLRNPSAIIANYRTQLQAEHQKLGQQILSQLQQTYSSYEQQHLEFSQHMRNQITAIEAQIEMERARQAGPQKPPALMMGGAGVRRSRFDTGPPPGQLVGGPPGGPPPGGPDAAYSFPPPQPSGPPQPLMSKQLGFPPPPERPLFEENWRPGWRVPGGDSDIDGEAMDGSTEPVMPNCPYFALPAGLIVPLIEIGDITFKPLEVSKLRVPPLTPPTPQLLMAMEAFYAPTAPDRPRDSFGWEKGLLQDFFERKQHIRQLLEESKCVDGVKFDDLITNRPSAAELEEEQQERLRTRLRSVGVTLGGGAGGASASGAAAGRNRGDRSRSSSRGSSRSRSASASGSSRTSSPKRARSRTRSRSGSASSGGEDRPTFGGSSSKRSPSPPAGTFLPPPSVSFRLQQPLGTDNKGAQLMQKMGWQGKGLGVDESGIQEPVSGGEIRERDEKYRGLGTRDDPFESFRKSRSGRYHERSMMYNRGAIKEPPP